MKIMKCLNAILSITFIQIAPFAYAGELSISLSERLQVAHDEEYISAIVRMADQADLKMATKGIMGRNKALRSRNVIRALRSKATARQGDLIAFLDREKSLGNVLSYTSFWIFNGFSIKATPVVIKKIASREDVEIINLDHPISQPDPIQTAPPETMTMQVDSPYTWNIEKINAPEVWEMGYDGGGVVVGIDEAYGVDHTHPDIAEKYRGGENSWFDPFGEHAVPVEFYEDGHGTHVAGIIAGGDANGKCIGVAPGVSWIAARTSNDEGEGCEESDYHEIYQWYLDPDGNPDTDDAPDVINCSYSLRNDTARLFVLRQRCDFMFQEDMKAWRMAGIIPVFSAGNRGPFFFTDTWPANYPETIAVGDTNLFDMLSFTSSRGPNNCDLSIFPDLCAPGTHIFSSIPNNDYTFKSGTSMAAPHVTGVIALMLDANPDLTVDEIESILKSTAKPIGLFHPNNSCGWGRVDALAAVNAALALQ